jgi:hypothetical protein
MTTSGLFLVLVFKGEEWVFGSIALRYVGFVFCFAMNFNVRISTNACLPTLTCFLSSFLGRFE